MGNGVEGRGDRVEGPKPDRYVVPGEAAEEQGFNDPLLDDRPYAVAGESPQESLGPGGLEKALCGHCIKREVSQSGGPGEGYRVPHGLAPVWKD